jgi:hypothetical protein
MALGEREGILLIIDVVPFISTLVLVERLCNCLITCSKDGGHPAARYGQLVRALASRLAAQSNSVRYSKTLLVHSTDC